jgi:acid stress chaperone HdeB
MQKLFGAVFLAAALMGAPRVSAQEINLSTMTCKDLFESNKDKVDFVVAWLLGYYTNDDDPPVFNFIVLKDTATKLDVYCAANPSDDLITAADEVID